MTPQLVHSHDHLSNRAKVRSMLDRKPVLKSVLDSPFEITWPPIPLNVQNLLLARLVSALENIRTLRKVPQKKRFSRQQDIAGEVEYGSIQSSPQALSQAPSTSAHVLVGINQVTRALEFQLRATRKHVFVHNPSQHPYQPSPSSPVVVVFVCSADVDPIALVAHIPHLVAGCNSARSVTRPIKLVPLPKGSESILSHILGVRRAAVLAFRHEYPLSEAFQDIISSIPVVNAPWLCPSDTQSPPRLVPTHVKQLRTTAPKDMKVAREQRSKARAAAKQRLSSSSRPTRRKPRMTLTTGTENNA